MSVHEAAGVAFESEVPVVIVGAGAAGLCAALAAHEAGAECAVIERDAVPRGSTALSAGLIPAAGTRFQRERGIADDAERFAADIMRKARNEPAPEIVKLVARGAALLVEWLADAYGLTFSVVDVSTTPATRRGACMDYARAPAPSSSIACAKPWSAQASR